MIKKEFENEPLDFLQSGQRALFVDRSVDFIVPAMNQSGASGHFPDASVP